MPQGNNKYRVSGAIFENNRPNGPKYSGFVEIDGVKTYLALWEKTSASGTVYLQVSEDKKPPGQNQQAQQPGRFPPNSAPAPQSPAPAPQRFHQGGGPVIPQSMRNDMDDDIPFAPEFR